MTTTTSLTPFTMTKGFILGLFEGDGSLFISISRKTSNVTGYQVRLSFKITLHEKDVAVLHAVRDFLGVGTVEVDHYSTTGTVYRYVVWNGKDIFRVIGPLLQSQPMVLAKRQNDVVLYLKALDIMSQGLHTTPDGLEEMRRLNAGLSGKMNKDDKMLLEPTNTPITNEWFQGFTMAEGSFYSIVTNSSTSALGVRIIVAFDISQELCEYEAVLQFQEFLGCGTVVNKSRHPSLRVQSRAALINSVFPFFDQYPLLGSKANRLALLKDIVTIMEDNKPLTQANITQISELIALMKLH